MVSKFVTHIVSITYFSALLCHSALAADNNKDETANINVQFESWQMSLLAQVQDKDGVTINPFVTDGCSGGMSAAWQYIAEVIPAFAQKYGDAPPWQACCVEHDKAYWWGETTNGYQKRLAADLQLEQCVSEFGKQHSEEYAQKYQLPAATIETNINIAAKLMYQAVRIGGKPCSLLPWRWGYGWPNCISNIPKADG